MIENNSQSNYMSKSDFDSAVSAFGASQWSLSSQSLQSLYYPATSSYGSYNLYRLADNYVISLLPVEDDKYDYTDASKKIQLAEIAYKLTNGQLIESTNKIEPTLTYSWLNIGKDGILDIDNYSGEPGYNKLSISYDGDGMLACKIADGWAFIDENNKIEVAVPAYVGGDVYIKAYEGHTYKAKIITISYRTDD